MSLKYEPASTVAADPRAGIRLLGAVPLGHARHPRGAHPTPQAEKTRFELTARAFKCLSLIERTAGILFD